MQSNDILSPELSIMEQPSVSKSRHVRHHGFVPGMILGMALLAGIYFMYLLISNDGETQLSRETGKNRSGTEIPKLYELGFWAFGSSDSLSDEVDPDYYQRKWNELISQNGYREMDSLFLDSVIRNMYFDSLSNAGSATQVDTAMVLQNDRLISSKNINAVVQKSLFGKNDTMLRDDYVYSQAKYKVEFWESPIHYRGYKRSGNFIVLYGVNPEKGIKVVQLDNQVYLQEGRSWFCIEETNGFEPTQNVSNQGILHRLGIALKNR